jgi:hypothetical protein
MENEKEKNDYVVREKKIYIGKIILKIRAEWNVFFITFHKLKDY